MTSPVGFTGAKGKKGATASTGAPGQKENSGSTGSPGLPGLMGATGSPGPSTGGVVYTCWGRTSCPSMTGAQLLYEGRAGKSFYNPGGRGNY